MKPTTVAVDLAKNVFEVAVSRRAGKVSERKRLCRTAFALYFRKLQPATVLMEACGSAHHWAREFRSFGHDVILLPPHAVRPYVVRNKTDRCDAKALLEAFRNEEIHPVPVKSQAQHALCSLHRLRSAWLAARTSRINTVRGLLRELGVTIPVGSHHVLPKLRRLVEDADAPLPDPMRVVLHEAANEIEELQRRIELAETEISALAPQTPVVARLRTIPGVGLLTSTALVAFVGDVSRFPSSRHFASYLGLTPRERSSGSTRSLGRISKRGDSYLRMLLIHGARSVLTRAKTMKNPDRLRTWAAQVQAARGHNKAAVALANKLARIAWAVWSRDVEFEANAAA
jgi:transposase